MNLPPLAPYPGSAVQQQIAAADWAVFVASWLSLARAYLGLADAAFAQVLRDGGALEPFLASYMTAQAQARIRPDSTPATTSGAALKKTVFLLTARVLTSKAPPPPAVLLQWGFLADFARVYGRRRVSAVLSGSSNKTPPHHHLAAVSVGVAEASLSALKKTLIKHMELQSKGDLRAVEDQLQRVNHLVAAWPAAGAQLLAGSDFFDALVACYSSSSTKNPPLRRTMITTAYVSLLSLTEPPTPRFSLLSDVLYSLRAAAADHADGPLSASDSLVAELVTSTPILQQLKLRTEAAGTATNRILPILRDLETHKTTGSGGIAVPAHRIKAARPDKGKGPEAATATATATSAAPQLHPHQLSLISQVQDLFPDLGSAFVAKLLDEYGDDAEQVVAHLLEDDLPPHLRDADRSQNLTDHTPIHMTPRSTPPPPPPPAPATSVPTRANVYDGDDLALRVKTAKASKVLHFGKQTLARTADDVLRDRSGAAPQKAAILSALAAFDADDDERDDTYDAVDVGGAVEPSAAAGDGDGTDGTDATDRALFAAYQATPALFGRDAGTRRSAGRRQLRDETRMTDEALEGWAVMLERNPQRRRRLEAMLAAAADAGAAAFTGGQNEIARTAWRQTNDDDDDNGEDGGGEGSARGGHRGRGRGRGRGGFPRPRGNVAGPTGDHDTEVARRRKEASKSSRANHNRRDGHARKMARGM